MKIINEPIKRAQLAEFTEIIDGEMVKAVVDVGRGILAVDAPMHADIEQFLLSDGSAQDDLWGINLYFSEDRELIEFDSMINMRPRQNNRSRDVEDSATRAKITEVVERWIK